MGAILVTIVIFLIVGATLALAPTHLASAASYTDSQRAQLSVEAGLSYARAKLREDLTWRASPDSGPHETVRMPDESLVIVEDHGNVIGLIQFEPGQFGQFRIRFNYQDGGGSQDGMDNPSRPNFVDHEFISANNLSGSTPLALIRDRRYQRYLANEMQQLAELFESDESVAPFQVYLAIEGRAGPGLRDASLDAPNEKPNGLRLVERMAEVRLEADFSETLDAAAMAAGDINATLYSQRPGAGRKEGSHLLVSSNKRGTAGTPPRIRSKGEVTAVRSDGGDEVSLKSPGGFANTSTGALGAGTVASPNLQVQTEDPNADFYSLEWDEIHHATSDPASGDTVNLDAGTYVVWEKSDGKPELHYYDMGMEQYTEHMKQNPGDPGQVLSQDLKEVRNNYSQLNGNQIVLRDNTDAETGNLEAQLLVKSDVHVSSTRQTSEFNYIPERGFMDGPPPNGVLPHPNEVAPDASFLNTNISFQFVNNEGRRKVTFTSDGDITLNSRVYGDGGAITSTSDINIVGVGKLDALGAENKGEGISLYSKGDITINTYKPNPNGETGRYNDIRLNGVLYAWGDINFELAPPPDETVPETFFSSYGQLLVKGAVVAYGGDPGDSVASTPGSGSGGVGPGRGH
ncbi:MAG: hypothetical protein KC800_25435, partial [Candidatus Eremiobacteraeota bacterium]|nr:hypothetical protein [Candidatus Eremiobacteraeota bacterium]